MDDDNEPNRIRQFGAFVTIPFVLAVPPVLGWLVGSWLDKWLDTDFMMYLFILLGFAAGFREFYRIVKRFGNGA